MLLPKPRTHSRMLLHRLPSWSDELFTPCVQSHAPAPRRSSHCRETPVFTSFRAKVRETHGVKMLVTGVTEVSHLVSLVPQSWRSRDRLYRHSHSLLDLRPFPALSAHGLSRRSPRGEIITTRGILFGTPARFRPVFVVQHRDLTAHGYHLCSLTDTIYWYKV